MSLRAVAAFSAVRQVRSGDDTWYIAMKHISQSFLLTATSDTIIAGHIILGIAQIRRGLENPFGHDVNDLPLDSFCHELASDIEAITSAPPTTTLEDWMKESGAQVMWPSLASTRRGSREV